jgi:hypothetical protein
MPKDSISSTMQNAFGHTVGQNDNSATVKDHNMCPVFSKEHSMGPDTISCVFGTTVAGRGDHGKPGKDAAVQSTMEPLK